METDRGFVALGINGTSKIQRDCKSSDRASDTKSPYLSADLFLRYTDVGVLKMD